MSDRVRVAILALALAGCGGAAPPPETPAEPPPSIDCDEARATQRAAEERLATCRASSPERAWAYQESFDWLESELGGRLDAARQERPTEVSRLEMQQIAERVWLLVDEIPEAERDAALLARIEDATEQLMHPLEEEERISALANMAGALGRLREQLEPAPTGDPCAAEAADAAGAWMSAQAMCSPEPSAGGEAP